VGQMCVPGLKLTIRLLKPVVVFSKTSRVCCNAPVLIHLELRNVFQTVFFISRGEHCIFLEDVDWHLVPYKIRFLRARHSVLVLLLLLLLHLTIV